MRIYKKFWAILIIVLLIVMAILIPALPVFAANFSVTLSALTGAPNTPLYAYATGLTANGTNTYTVLFGTTTVVGTTIIPSGTINAYFGVPVLARGSYNITITTTSDSQNTPYPSFVIVPQIFLGTSSGHIGDHLVVSGDGFAASTAITIYFDGVPQTPSSAISTNALGQFANAIITIPSTWGGNHTITAADYYGQSTGVTYSISSNMTLSATTGVVGSSITASGVGFAANSVISFLIDGNAMNGSATTDAYGKFTNINLVIPATFGGSHVITAQDSASHSATANLSVTATMTMSPVSGPVGTAVAITGQGFLASSPITLTYDSTNITPISSLTSGVDGSVSTTFKVPASASGNHVVAASDGTDTISANFNSLSSAVVNPASGPVGTTITASGTGFKANGNITITYNNVQAGTTNANGLGNFTTTFAIPSASTGAHSLVITDQTNTQTFSFSVTPTTNFGPTSGYIGTTLTISGTGFSANKGLTVTYDSTLVTLAVPNTSDANGTFNVSFKAPISKSGNHSVVVTDGTTSHTFTFAISATPPPVPTLSIPADSTKLGKIPTLSWTPVTDSNGGITYTLEISKDAAFTTLILQKTGLTAPTYTLDTQNPQEKLKSATKSAPYYWRVQATDGASNTSAWTTPHTFLVGLALGDYAGYIIMGVIAIMLGALGFVLGRLTRRRV